MDFNISWVNNNLDPNNTNCTPPQTPFNFYPSLTSLTLLPLGVLYCSFGFRCFKSVLFFTGFTSGFGIVFLVCQEEELLSEGGNFGISLLSGVLYGLICLLVPYVGFFTLGFHAGVILGLGLLVFLGLDNAWVAVAVVMATGLSTSVLNVSHPPATKLTTSLVGATFISVSFDYFIQRFELSNQLIQHLQPSKINTKDLCWYQTLMLCLWPLLLVLGILIQHYLTAKGFSVNYRNNARQMTRQERAEYKEAKYRYFYGKRRAGGDFLSRFYLQGVFGGDDSTGRTEVNE